MACELRYPWFGEDFLGPRLSAEIKAKLSANGASPGEIEDALTPRDWWGPMEPADVAAAILAQYGATPAFASTEAKVGVGIAVIAALAVGGAVWLMRSPTWIYTSQDYTAAGLGPLRVLREDVSEQDLPGEDAGFKMASRGQNIIVRRHSSADQLAEIVVYDAHAKT